MAGHGWNPTSRQALTPATPSTATPFVAAAARRDDHSRVHRDRLPGGEYQQIVARLDLTLKTTRLYADYLRSIEINTRA